MPPVIARHPLQGRRIRIPTNLVYSRHHSPLAVTAYALLDVIGNGDPVEASRQWLARRLDCSLGGIAKALTALGTAHDGGDLTPDLPVLLVSTQRGRGWTAQRVTIPGVPFVDVPEWSLGDDINGPLVRHLAWRLYAILLHKRAPGRATVALPRRELAQLLRVRPDSMPALLRELVGAGLLVTAERPGDTTLLLPLTRQLTASERDALAGALARTGDPVDKGVATQVDDGRPHPRAGSAPHPHPGTGPHPSTGSPYRRTDLNREDLGEPACVPARTAAPRRTGTPEKPARGGRPSPVRHALRWCGRCDASSRTTIDDDTGFLTGTACPTCHGDQERAA